MRVTPSVLAMLLAFGLAGPVLAQPVSAQQVLAQDATSQEAAPEATAPQDTAPADAASDAAAPQQDAAPQEAAPDESASGDQSAPLLDEAQLEQLVAPIALYPDPLLAQVLIAATYPLEVVQAERWVEAHKDLKGDALTEAVDQQDWDNSIKALAAVPDVLSMMNQNLDWTSDLGDAVLAQQDDVMAAVQSLRLKAQENGKLESNDQQTVTVQQEVNQQPVVVIQPTQPQTVYVPYYEPQVVYGGWAYPDYPPYYFPPRPGYVVGGAIATGLAWSAGFAIGNAIWGDGFDWHHDDIRVNVNRNVNIHDNNVKIGNWQHNSYHRRGVNYNNQQVKNKYAKANTSNKRPDYRGRGPGKAPGGKGPGKGPGGGPDLANRPGGGGKPGPGGANRPDIGNIKPGPGGDKRPSVGDLEAELKRKPGAGNVKPGQGGKPAIGKAPDIKKPNAPKPNVPKPKIAKPDIKKPSAPKPNVAKPNIKKPSAPKPQAKPQVKRPSGNAFNKGDGAKAKSFSNRGKASVGHRSPSHMARAPARRPSGGAHRRRR
ncbi:DUF3300 domain-containing protein [Methyloligella sp. 2.7D]|uniref:DUF3300 domain-containing protein n=1 Tax=unclassified Methyloligella TaxID=2625955 RepID=UPI001FF034FF|nr:DUF3300 domain-containing protein [Methyloligella sp. GL2]